MLFNLIKEVKDVNRFRNILTVLFEEGFDFLIEELKLKRHISFLPRFASTFKKKQKTEPHVIFRRTLERLGPTFIKLGQLLSVRPDLVPKEYMKELEMLQDKVEPFHYEEVRKIIKDSFGKNIEQLFLHFEHNPIASASISQVHRAVLKNGDVVAVKVQRPNIKTIMETDIDIMFFFARMIEKHSETLAQFRPVRIIKEFKEWTEKELDFRIEARNTKRFHENFKNNKIVHIPKIYDEFSSEKVLALEFIDGVELHNINELKKRKYDIKKIIENGFYAIMEQVFVHGIFHADPHPGNILILKDNSIAFIDFGIVGYFDERLKSKFIDLLYAIVHQDEDLILDTLINLGMENENFDLDEMRSDISYIINPLKNSKISEIHISKVLEDILQMAVKHKLRIPASFVLFGKTIITLEGVALEYSPDLKMIETARPFVEKLIAKRSSPINIWKKLVHNVSIYQRFAESFPEKIERALDKVQKGSIKIDIEDKDIKKLVGELDRSSNRVAYGLLIASLLITSAILVAIEKGPMILGIPALAFISFTIASCLSLILFYSILKEKF